MTLLFLSWRWCSVCPSPEHEVSSPLGYTCSSALTTCCWHWKVERESTLDKTFSVERTGRTKERERRGRTLAAQSSSAWRPAPQLIPGHFALPPHGGVSRARGGRWYSPFSPRSADSGSFDGRKALWEELAVLFSALGSVCSAFRGPRWRVASGAGEDLTAALSLVTCTRSPGRVCSPAPWVHGGQRPGLTSATLSGTPGGSAFLC